MNTNLTSMLFSFFALMLLKFEEKEREGKTGWDSLTEEHEADIRYKLNEAVLLREWVNVANYSMILWYHDTAKASKEKFEELMRQMRLGSL